MATFIRSSEETLGLISMVFTTPDNSESDGIHISILNEKSDNYTFKESFFYNGSKEKYLYLNLYKLPIGGYEIIVDNCGELYKTSFTINHRSEFADKISAKVAQYGSPLIIEDQIDSSYFPFATDELTPWFDKPDAGDFIQQLFETGEINSEERGILIDFVQKGYMVLENIFSDSFIDKVNSEIDDAIKNNYNGYQYGTSTRIEHLHLHYESINQIWLNTECKRLIDILFQSHARPCQTLTFVFGSQQDAHQDTIHLTPFPSGLMCGLWIALQDIQPNSGELVVYPYSHREPRLRMDALGCSKVTNGNWAEFGAKAVPAWEEMCKKYERVVYRPKKGTALIWHENLLHGGSIRLDKNLERRSIVIHYFSDEAIGFYDSSGMAAMAAPVSKFY